MKTSELKRILKKGGCYKIREGGNHEVWYSPKTGKQFTVDRHDSKEIATGTANRILKDAGLK
ncbi:MAG: type II toxin-antitoxin system HicA family toxin [Oscillospiraceae bacterium]|nr:type II toxin-antitoxin system HicA family toxin [Oscillospiraceae bacterium]